MQLTANNGNLTPKCKTCQAAHFIAYGDIIDRIKRFIGLRLCKSCVKGHSTCICTQLN